MVTTLPVGAGLASAAALEVALALALGCGDDPVSLARACQHAEQVATGVPTGIMDQLVVSAATEGCALLIDFADLSMEPVAMPGDAEVVVVHSGASTRSLDRSAYAQRRAECDLAARGLGPLGRVEAQAAGAMPDPLLRRRARHVAGECERVRWFTAALRAGDLAEAGEHHVGQPRQPGERLRGVDAGAQLVGGDADVAAGVLGARLTGAGFGGCVVALADRAHSTWTRSGPGRGGCRPHPAPASSPTPSPTVDCRPPEQDVGHNRSSSFRFLEGELGFGDDPRRRSSSSCIRRSATESSPAGRGGRGIPDGGVSSCCAARNPRGTVGAAPSNRIADGTGRIGTRHGGAGRRSAR